MKQELAAANKAHGAARKALGRALALDQAAAKRGARTAAPTSAIDRYRAEVKARQKAEEHEALTEMVGSVQRNTRAGREALASSPKPRGGLERSVEHGIMSGKTTGSKVMARIEGGDLRAAKALRKYMDRLGSARFYNAAHAKYDKRTT